MRVILILLLLFVAPASGYSQTPAASPIPKHKTKVETSYDARMNVTCALIRLELYNPSGIAEASYERVDLLISFSYPGKKIVTPQTVTLSGYSAMTGR